MVLITASRSCGLIARADGVATAAELGDGVFE
jgi:hypothetical protein